MGRKFVCGLALALAMASAFAAQRANAFIINFTAAGVPHGPSLAADATASTLNVTTPIGTVVFGGGAVLTNEVALPADTGTVYYTSFFCCGTGTTPNTLTITFPQPITNFFVDLYNGQVDTDTFTASDNSGESTTVSIPPNSSSGTSLISFPALGDVVTITTSDPNYDFSIDNIGFDQPTPGTPEPSTWAMLLLGFAGLSFVGYRRTKSRCATLAAS
jgi:PEP-CTERM motif